MYYFSIIHAYIITTAYVRKIKNDINLIIWRADSKRLKTNHFYTLTISEKWYSKILV